ncbi:MAG TPA: GSCFA domain-containing protein [Fulvivirga sp.]|nr:GSCFA domain-containing protein [Fulvivirga sp.]
MFRTELNIETANVKIGHQDPILTLGSCFSDSMGIRFNNNKFNTCSNPFGTVYNPISIFKLLEYSVNNKLPGEGGLIENDGLYAHYDFHSSFSALDQKELKKNIKEQIKGVHHFIKTAKWLLLTFGTAYVYERKDNGEIVSNCHKIPAGQFCKKLLTQKQILESFESVWQQIVKLNPDINVLLTVSPVRHVKDTLVSNSVSKATLRLTCDTLVSQYANINYFPSFELMIDDLRDYRFYKSDMIHPTEEAEEYIWNKFAATYFEASTLAFISEWSKIRAAIQHRPFNPASDKHQKFVKATIKKIQSLGKNLDYSEELRELERQLK